MPSDDRRKVVYACGCFEFMHSGHLDYLKRTSKLGRLIVGVTSDKTFEKEKGREPFFDENVRSKLVGSLGFVAIPIITDCHLDTIMHIKPNYYAKGGDYNLDTINQEERRYVENHGGKVVVIPKVYDISSTEIIERIRNGK